VRSTPCAQCGAIHDRPDESCADRFDALLALDHSRREPWGSRHGLAFAAYALQHPDDQTIESLDRCWVMLCRVYVAGDDRMDVARGLRMLGSRSAADWSVPPRPHASRAPNPFTTTIADLGDFDAADYPARLDAWCRATLAGWGLMLPEA
jgi:hypothetical protein